MSRRRRNIDEDAVPASGGSVIGDPNSYNRTIDILQCKSKKQIDKIARLATFTEQMKFHLGLFVLSLMASGRRADADRASRIQKVIDQYDEWKSAD